MALKISMKKLYLAAALLLAAPQLQCCPPDHTLFYVAVVYGTYYTVELSRGLWDVAVGLVSEAKKQESKEASSELTGKELEEALKKPVNLEKKLTA